MMNRVITTTYMRKCCRTVVAIGVILLVVSGGCGRTGQLEERITAMEGSLEVQKKENSTLKSDLVATSQQIQGLEEKNVALEQEKARLASSLTTAQKQIAELDARGRDLERRTSKPIQIQPRITLPPSKPKKEVDVIIKSVTIHSTKSNGDDWDSDSEADLAVDIEDTAFGGDSYSTKTKKDVGTYTSFNVRSIRVSEGDTIQVSVYDRDFMNDDLVGSYTKEITADTISARTAQWSFQQVNSLELVFEP